MWRSCIQRITTEGASGLTRAYRVIFKFVQPDHAELRYIGYHHSIYDYDMFR